MVLFEAREKSGVNDRGRTRLLEKTKKSLFNDGRSLDVPLSNLASHNVGIVYIICVTCNPDQQNEPNNVIIGSNFQFEFDQKIHADRPGLQECQCRCRIHYSPATTANDNVKHHLLHFDVSNATPTPLCGTSPVPSRWENKACSCVLFGRKSSSSRWTFLAVIQTLACLPANGIVIGNRRRFAFLLVVVLTSTPVQTTSRCPHRRRPSLHYATDPSGVCFILSINLLPTPSLQYGLRSAVPLAFLVFSSSLLLTLLPTPFSLHAGLRYAIPLSLLASLSSLLTDLWPTAFITKHRRRSIAENNPASSSLRSNLASSPDQQLTRCSNNTDYRCRWRSLLPSESSLFPRVRASI